VLEQQRLHGLARHLQHCVCVWRAHARRQRDQRQAQSTQRARRAAPRLACGVPPRHTHPRATHRAHTLSAAR
jgi:hypothetical protein